MKKLGLVMITLLLVGCSGKESQQSPGIQFYRNHDNNCILEVVSQDYSDPLEPTDLLKDVDSCFIGKIERIEKAEAYDDGRLKTPYIVNVEKVIKGQPKQQVKVYRDGGKCPLLDYIKLEKTYIDKEKLELIPESVRGSKYIEIVPTAYFQVQFDQDYVFFIKDQHIYQDAYGLLEVNDEVMINKYENKKYSLTDLDK